MKGNRKWLFLAAVLIRFAWGPVPVRSAEAHSQIYKLGEGSTYQRGCFAPCLCPILESRPIRGTFRLTASEPQGSFDVYEVLDINWIVATGDSELRITGSGTYRFGGDHTPMQQLQLDLVVGAGEATRFDSGLIPASTAFPKISITLSINGMHCFDTVLELNGSPVPADQLWFYELSDGSTYQKGCFPPCRCAIFSKQSVTGSFGLVELKKNPLFVEYAVVNVGWQARSLDPSRDDVRITGAGTYRVGGEFAVTQRLVLDLKVENSKLTRFDSGLVVGGGKFPIIDIIASVNRMYCYDQVIHVQAKPIGPALVHWWQVKH